MLSKDSIESQAADDKTIRGEHVWPSSFKEISTVPFRMEKEDYLSKQCTIFYYGFSGKLGCLRFSKKIVVKVKWNINSFFF